MDSERYEPTTGEAVAMAQHGIALVTRAMTEPELVIEDLTRGYDLDAVHHAIGGLIAVSVSAIKAWAQATGLQPAQALAELALVIAQKDDN